MYVFPSICVILRYLYNQLPVPIEGVMKEKSTHQSYSHYRFMYTLRLPLFQLRTKVFFFFLHILNEIL